MLETTDRIAPGHRHTQSFSTKENNIARSLHDPARFAQQLYSDDPVELFSSV
jgi:hypothetical protein